MGQRICGNHDKLTEHTGWSPELGLDEILKDSLEYWRAVNMCGGEAIK